MTLARVMQLSHFTLCCHFAVCTISPVLSHQTFWLTRRQKQFRGTEPEYVLQLDKSELRNEVSCIER